MATKKNYIYLENQIYRILDANLNRLREALRIIEEHYRFIISNKNIASSLKTLRHSLENIEKKLGQKKLLNARDVKSDPFSQNNKKNELNRENSLDVLTANFKRAQESARVIEEYVKVLKKFGLSLAAKRIRFSLYSLEKELS
jgi:thiamine-phosphate pyrophosphorylase